MESNLNSLWQLAGGKIPEDWNIVSLEDLLISSKSITVGVMYPGKHCEEGVPLIRVSDVKNGHILQKPDFYISSSVDEEHRRTRLSGNEFLITLVGNPGDCVVVDERMIGWNAARALAVLRLKNPELREWLKLILLSPASKHIIDSRLNTTVQRTLNLKDIKELPIPLPPEGIRKEITSVEVSFQMKEQLNLKINRTLEQMAQALFKSWFVDFDPVIDNALSAGTNVSDFPEALQQRAELRKQAQQLPDFKALPDDIHSLFPSEFEQTDEPNVGSHGWIPKGWDVKSLSDLLEVKYGKDHKKLNEGLYPVYGSGGLMRNAEKFLYEGESVLIPRKGTLTNIMYVNEKFWTVDTMFYTIPMLENVAKFTFYHLKTLDFTLMNVGSAVPSMTTKVLNALQVITPTTELLQKFDEIIGVNNQKVVANEFNTQQLEKLRDTLLPKLISGELTIPDSIKTENNVNHQQPKEPLSHHA
jgi:type I restriction enzyme S subunit